MPCLSDSSEYLLKPSRSMLDPGQPVNHFAPSSWQWSIPGACALYGFFALQPPQIPSERMPIRSAR
jgi:hypothetical protein